MMTENIYFTGKIVATFFSNESNFYKVLLLQITDTNCESYEDSEIVITGTIGDIIEDDSYSFTGQLTSHPKYGEQLKVLSYEKLAYGTTDGLIKYLSSDKFPGIGKETAKKILKAYPEDTVSKVLESPEMLDDILSLAKKNSFLKRLSQDQGTENIISKLYSFGLNGRLAGKILKTYQAESLNIIKENPYQLVEDIEGIGFLTADKIAFEHDIPADSPERLRAALIHCLQDFIHQTGDSYIKKEMLLPIAKQLLESARQTVIQAESLSYEMEQLISDKRIIDINGKIFDCVLYHAEKKIASELTRLLKGDKEKIDQKKFEKTLTEVEEDLAISYDELQKSAILKALESPVFILTGGPGTGKTTIVNGFLEVYARMNQLDLDPNSYGNELFPFVLAAPTGRASRRLNELTGLPASTLHRALGITAEDSDDDYTNDLSGQLLIVDEFSMVDTWLASKLFSAVPNKMKVLIVGDMDQLASVGPGQILTDFLRFPKIPSVRLNKIYRQSEDSTITSLAHDIKDGQLPADFREKKADRNFFPVNAYQLSDLIAQIANSWKKRGNDPFDFQVLIPMYKGPAGITATNKSLQEIFNPLEGRLEFSHLEGSFREGDKVLQLVNQAESNVFNGDLGQIIELIPSKHSESKQDELVIDFDGQELNYMRSDWSSIRLAYAMSIHKAQGSEFETVIVPLVSSYSRMLQRNLLYTAITRAKSSVILLGEMEAFQAAVERKGTDRNTFLLEQIQHFSGEIPLEIKEEQEGNDILRESMIDSEEVDPLIGLTEVDFQIFSQ